MDDGRVVCQCDHLTNFAILLDIKGQGDIIDPTNTVILSVITIIGFSLSIIGLGFTVLSFILFKPLRQGRGQQTLLNLALALLCSMIIFLAGMERTESYYGCIAVAALMHYFLLVSFMWMLVEGFLQYLRFVRVLGTYIPRFMLKASIPAWGLPLLPVIIVLAVDYDLYKGGNYYCWMSRTPFYFAFLIPMALIILINCIIFFMVLKTLLTRSKTLQSNQSESKRAMMNLRASISIFIILGLSWTFGILAIEDARVVFSYIFTILTTFQGFIIFILFIARGKKLRYNWKKLCCKRFEGKGKKYKVTSDSSGNAALKFNNASYDSHTASTELK
ncbi:adhesion G-protein coupled receptor G2-like isoform X2 [Ostrea edulis]|nr:adhesion G-protein coupled receptor G2-like isoform X2 [Ostrea edulis]XP_056012077.1 adhesion G-protein coupled receptor G2-like isoform X2 [Ostrea edulis]